MSTLNKIVKRNIIRINEEYQMGCISLQEFYDRNYDNLYNNTEKVTKEMMDEMIRLKLVDSKKIKSLYKEYCTTNSLKISKWFRIKKYELKTRLKVIYWVFAHKNGYGLLTDEVKRIIKYTFKTN